MRKSQLGRVTLTRRDREILQLLFKNKVLSWEYMQRYIFGDASRQTVNSRINKLHRSGWIDRKPIEVNGNLRFVYGLSRPGLDLIRCDLPYEVNKNQFVSDSIEHDLVLAEISKVFEQFKIVSQIFTEAELISVSEFLERPRFRPFVSLRSDRLLVLRNDSSASYVALEYERVQKSSVRLKQKFEDYYLNRGVSAVLYVCENQQMIKSMMKIDKELSQKNKSKIYFCSLSEIKSSSQELIFCNSEDGKLTFR